METLNIPKIKVATDKSKELDFFLKFLHSKEFPGHREMILSVHPKLRTYLKTREGEITSIKKYLDEFYTENRSAIDAAIERARRDFLRADEALRLLAGAMDFQWPAAVEVAVVLTFGSGSDSIKIIKKPREGFFGWQELAKIHQRIKCS